MKKASVRTAAALAVIAFTLPLLFSCGHGSSGKERRTYVFDNYITEKRGDECVIKGYLGIESRVTVPAELGGLTVTEISENAFYGCVALTGITLPGSVKVINRAFVGCPDLEYADLGGGIVEMEGAFYGCPALSRVTGFEKAEYMAEAFRGCGALKECYIPPTAVDCTDAFRDCVTLTGVTVYDGAAGLDGTFTDCISLRSVSLPESVTELKNTFRDCASLTDVEGMESVTVLDGSFAGCTSLKEITLGRFVTDMRGVFTGCLALERVGNMPLTIETYSPCFGGCSSMTYLRVPKINSAESEAEYDPAEDFRGCASLKTVMIDSDVTAQDSFCKVFGDCSSLEVMTLTGKTVKAFTEVGYVFTDEPYEGNDQRVANAILSYSKDAGSRNQADYAVINGVSYSHITGSEIGYFDADEIAAKSNPAGFINYSRKLIWLGFPTGGSQKKETVAFMRTYEFCLTPTGKNDGSLPETFYINGALCRVN